MKARRLSFLRPSRLYSARATLATIGLGLVLATLTAVCTWAAQNVQATSTEVDQRLRIAAAHEAVLEDVESEHTAMLHYLDSPQARDPRRYAAQQRAVYEASRLRLAEAAESVRLLGDTSDRTVVEYVLVVENRYHPTVQAMFQAIDAGRLTQAQQLEREETGPAVESLLQLVRATADKQRSKATSQMNRLEMRSKWFVRFLLAVFGVAFLFLAGCWTILLSMQRHLHRQATALVREKALVEGVIAATPTLLYWKDVALRYQGGSEAFLQLRSLGSQAELLGHVDGDLKDLLGHELTTIENEVLAGGEAVMNRQVTVKGPNGQHHQLLLSVIPRRGPRGGVDGVIGAGADVTHITDLERQLAIASRLESIGQLAAGIAHEINTPIQFVTDNTRFVRESLDRILAGLTQIEHLARDETVAASAVQAVLEEIDLRFVSDEVPTALIESQDGLRRVAEIVRALKEFSHPSEVRADTDLNRAIEAVVQVSRSAWRDIAEVTLELDDSVGLVSCFEGELKHALLNIVINAAQAIDGQENQVRDGRIIISSVRNPQGVRITVQDNGPGMSQDVKQRIFDLFFTTKPFGQGSGQGLALAHNTIVKKHGGAIDVDSDPSAGTTFTITLPDQPGVSTSPAATPEPALTTPTE